MARHEVWVFQRTDEVKRLGADKAAWCVGWYEPDGRRKSESCGTGSRGKRRAEQRARELEGLLMTGQYERNPRVTWEKFREEYGRRVLDGMGPANRTQTEIALAKFERIVRPKMVFSLDTGHVDDFVAARLRGEQSKGGKAPSPATLNKELRHLRAVLNAAVEWGYLAKLPRFKWQKEPGKLPTYCPPEHFTAIYNACDTVRWPDGFPFAPADWWRGVLVVAMMTGWRIGQILALRREDVDMEACTAVSRAEGNKGKRDVLIPLDPDVVAHLRKVPSFEPVFFPWDRSHRAIFQEFTRLQDAGGVKPRGKRHYGFHDFRRAFATLNAEHLTPDALQRLMQHTDYQTTQRYIDMSRQLKPAVARLFKPEVIRGAGQA